MGTRVGVVSLVVGEERREEERLSGASWSCQVDVVFTRDRGTGRSGGREKTNKGTEED